MNQSVDPALVGGGSVWAAACAARSADSASQLRVPPSGSDLAHCPVRGSSAEHSVVISRRWSMR